MAAGAVPWAGDRRSQGRGRGGSEGQGLQGCAVCHSCVPAGHAVCALQREGLGLVG